MRKNKKGAASFYIVAFSTLILIIIAASFAAVIISEVTRTSNDDLAQSAYDSALAGVEDAKLAFYNYQSCAGASAEVPDFGVSGVTCNEIVYWMEHQDCDMVAHILGRIGKGDSGEVFVKESKEAGNNMQQAYTCVKLSDMLGDYRGSLTGSNQSRVIRPKFDATGEAEVHAKDIRYLKLSWYSDANAGSLVANYNNFESKEGSEPGQVVFPSVGTQGTTIPTPPTVAVGLVQTQAKEGEWGKGAFNLSDFTFSDGDRTNRGMIYLVPTNDKGDASKNVQDATTYIGTYDQGTGENYIGSSAMVKSNDKTRTNLPYAVYCDELNDYACSATIELPKAVGGGERADDTFAIIMSLPYGKPNTDFVLEFYCGSDRTKPCGGYTVLPEEEGGGEERDDRADLKWVQISVDSTGRANDLYRRVETRLEGSNAFSLSTIGVLEILGNKSDGIWKDFAVTCENDFTTNNDYKCKN